MALTSIYPDWVDAVKGDVYKSVFSQIDAFDEGVTAGVNAATLKGLKVYSGRGYPSPHSNSYSNDIDVTGQLGLSSSVSKLNFNITAVIIDTLAAKLASIQATPQAVTNRGNAKGRQLADDLNFLLKGLFHKYNLSHQLNLAFKDAMINRAGYLKVVKEDNDICIERVYADEVIIDNADGYYNKPYKMLHRKIVPLHVMIEKFPDKKVEIEASKITEVRQHNSRNYTPSVSVVEGWCLNTYKNKGRHTITIENADLVDEEWNKEYFPILRCDYNEPVIGWLGTSVVDDLAPIQMEIDRILITMQAILKIMSVPRMLIDTNSEVNKNHLTNKVGLCIFYDGKQGVAPVIHNGASMPPELMAQLKFLIEQAYARAGLTPMDTQGQQKTGSGNTSGEALKTMTDIKSERWQLLQNNFEAKHVELAQIILNELQGEKFKISSLDRTIGLKEISTKVIPKTNDSYVLKMFPVSSLPDSIPDLIDSVEKMLQLGVIDKAQVPDLMNIPDLDSNIALMSAPMRLIDKKIENMLETGKYWAPEPYHNLDYAIMTAIQHINWAELNDEDDKKIALLRRFINDVQQLIQQRVPAAPPAPVVPQ
jgi:hypothetical protein